MSISLETNHSGDPGISSVEDIEAELEEAYFLMKLSRMLDEKATKKSRSGVISTFPGLKGQAAAQVGAGMALEEDDWLFPTYRDNGMYLARGFTVEDIFIHLRGQGNYIDREYPEDPTTFPPAIPIATQLPHAVGAGMASNYEDNDDAVLVSFGDGATSEGDFHEAMNFASVFDSPVVFYCQNNQWAISTGTERQTAANTFAQKADAYGLPGLKIDGNDFEEVFSTVSQALDYARNEGPIMIEAETQRLGPHTTTDDPSVYRDQEEIEQYPDPVEQFEQELKDYGILDEEGINAVEEMAEKEIDEGLRAALNSDQYSSPEEVFNHVYSHPTERQRRQLEKALEYNHSPPMEE